MLVIDVQPRFVDSMAGDPEPVLVRIEQLIRLAETLDLPIIATLEEPVTAKGELPARLRRVFPGQGRILRKWTYDCCAEPEIEAAIRGSGRAQMAVAGAEWDVCVLQTVLSLLDMGLEVFLLEDCLFSSTADIEAARERMRRAGAVPLTYKTLFYELLGRVQTEALPAGLLSPMELPP